MKAIGVFSVIIYACLSGMGVYATSFGMQGTIGLNAAAPLMQLPDTQTVIPPYGAIVSPVLSTEPTQAMPVAVGSIAQGGSTFTLGLQTEQFTGPADIYVALFAPALDPANIYLVTPTGIQTLASAGLVPWMTSVPGLNSVPFGTIPASSLPPATYTIFLAITPFGTLNAFDVWETGFAVSPFQGSTSSDVLTYHNDNARTGQNLNETILTTSNVNMDSFGKLFVIPADGKVDAQPLYVSNVGIPGDGNHNLLIVATEHDSVYAFDADTGAPIWHVSMLQPGETTSDDHGCGQVTPEIGVTATPVIDRKAGPHGTVYVVAMSKNGVGHYSQRLHALDLTSGAEEFGGPREISATYPGTGDNSSGGIVSFDPGQYKERPGLLLVNGVVYTAWSSHCDIRPYTGWLIGYDQITLARVAVLNLTPNGNEGSFWNSGAAPATDANGTIFALQANGTFDTSLDANGFPVLGDFGNSFLKISTTNNQLVAVDYFAPFNVVAENSVDEDLGSGGALVLPDLTDSGGKTRRLAVGAGKDAHIYVVDRDNMGKFNPVNNSKIYQDITGALGGPEFGMPAYYNGTIYYGAVGDYLKAFRFSNALLASTPASKTNNVFPYPGATPSISANGNTNGIVWAAENGNPAVLHAYDAARLSRELYDSNLAPGGRDHFGTGNKFITPTVANGKVYVGTINGVGVFGLLVR